jgi:hypothetical protein
MTLMYQVSAQSGFLKVLKTKQKDSWQFDYQMHTAAQLWQLDGNDFVSLTGPEQPSGKVLDPLRCCALRHAY